MVEEFQIRFENSEFNKEKVKLKVIKGDKITIKD